MLLIALLIIAAAVYLMVRRVEVRLVLLGAGLLMATLAGQPLVIFDTFTRAMVAGMVAPICAAMGFAAVLSATGCDRELVHLLLAPLRRARWLVVPGGIIVAYLVNMAVPSQTSTAAAVGPILVPLMLAAGVGPVVAGAALVLGASFGGDLLNPAAQDVQALAGVTRLSAPAISARVIPASLAGMLVAAVTFTLLNRLRKAEGRGQRAEGKGESPTLTPTPTLTRYFEHEQEQEHDPSPLTPAPLRLIKALIPLVPVALLLIAYAGWAPLAWLLRAPEGEEWRALAGALPVVRAMLIGTLLAAAICWREIQPLTRSLFEGMGFAYANIISLTITAQCFGAGIGAIGVSQALLKLLDAGSSLALLLACGIPWSMAVLSGSGSGPILTFAQTFLAHVEARHDPVTLGAVACLAGAFGRTMSPVAAVVIYSSGLVGVSPLPLIRQLLPALLAGALTALALAALPAWR
jgi:DcuC family C4-dicarboxylate transporter